MHQMYFVLPHQTYFYHRTPTLKLHRLIRYFHHRCCIQVYSTLLVQQLLNQILLFPVLKEAMDQDR